MTYIISDIHGEYELFMRLLDKIKFSSGDKIYVLGDMIDKGTQSARLLNCLRKMPQATCIYGNHEYDFIKYYHAQMKNERVDFDEVLQKLRNYLGFDCNLLEWETMDWLENLPFYIEEDLFIGVHSGLPLSADGKLLPPEKATCEQLVYDRNFKDNRNIADSEKCVLFGHTPARYLTNRDEIIIYPKRGRRADNIRNIQKIHLDTGVYLSGVLGCFCVEECNCYYVCKNI